MRWWPTTDLGRLHLVGTTIIPKNVFPAIVRHVQVSEKQRAYRKRQSQVTGRTVARAKRVDGEWQDRLKIFDLDSLDDKEDEDIDEHGEKEPEVTKDGRQARLPFKNLSYEFQFTKNWLSGKRFYNKIVEFARIWMNFVDFGNEIRV